MSHDELMNRLAAFAREFDARLAGYLEPVGEAPAKLVEAMRFSALAPGKRIRPYLTVRCCELVGGAREAAWPVAAAVECIHAFSLIHDDLPAMDDDDMRRGRPSCHKQFGEAIAILAGDGLSVLAFELLGRYVSDPTLAARLVVELAGGTGWAGMIGGQLRDIEGESEPPSVALVRYVHECKTAALFSAASRMGAIVGKGTNPEVERVGRYGRELGLAFQIADDLLDVTGKGTKVGKRVGKDEVSRKQTFPRCVGVEASRAEAGRAVETAIGQLDPFGERAEDLRELARFVVSREI